MEALQEFTTLKKDDLGIKGYPRCGDTRGTLQRLDDFRLGPVDREFAPQKNS